MSFEEWNNALLGHFFMEGRGLRRVRLYVTDKVINEVGRSQDLGMLGDFLNAVEEGPDCAEGKNLLTRVNYLRERAASMNHQQRAQYRPDFLPYICLFVLAARYEIGERANGLDYYRRLHEVRGKPPDKIGAGEMAQLFGLAKLLEDWSVKYQKGGLGLFTVIDRPGAHRYTSFWRSQVLLSPEERKKLPELFYHLDLAPTDPPGKDEMHRLIAGSRLAREMFGSRSGNPDLAGEILAEFGDWDGRVQVPCDGVTQEVTRAPARLVLAQAKAIPRLQIFIEIAGEDLPETIRLAAEDGDKYTCRRHGPEIFGPLKSSDGITLDAASWLDKSTELRGKINGGKIAFELLVKCNLSRAGYHMQWNQYGRCWIPRQNLDSTGDILVLSRTQQNRDEDAILRWAAVDNIPMEAVPNDGLPHGWTATQIKAKGIAAARGTFPSFAPKGNVVIRLVGGVRAGRGAVYFDFGLPIIHVEGSLEGVSVEASRLGGCAVDLCELKAAPEEPCSPGREYRMALADSGQIQAEGACVQVVASREGSPLAKREFFVQAACRRAAPQSNEDQEIHFTLGGDQETSPSSGERAGPSLIFGASITGPQPALYTEIGNGAPDPAGAPYDDRPERFLHVLSAWGDLAIHAAKDLAHNLINGEGALSELDRWRDIIWSQFKALRWLGHCEIVEKNGRWDRIVACPPALALLPGKYCDGETGWHYFRAVLCGQRKQGTVARIIGSARSRQIEVLIHPQAPYYPLVPQRILFQSRNNEELTALASEVNGEIPVQLAAQRLLSEIPAMGEVFASLKWQPGPPPGNGWTRRIFDPAGLCTGTVATLSESGLTLVELRNETDRSWFHCLARNGQYAQVSREIGRWITCLGIGRPALRTPVGELVLPVELEPSAIWGRAFSLCSGFAPKVVQYPLAESPFKNSGAYPAPPKTPVDSAYARQSGQYSGHFYLFARAAQWFDPRRAGFSGWCDLPLMALDDLAC